ncbi:MAG: DUF5667 domain-containing protein [Candidatus Methanoperedens sp.]|nr:DUF5667 domain-containing protein [Candidatus Methanoperedens sp.]
MKKIMKHIMISGTILLALALTINIGTAYPNDLTGDTTEETFEDIAPYEGSIGPGSAFYGLKIAFENFGEIFTFNESEKIEIQLEHARSRLAEAKAELRRNNGDYANIAIEGYREKIKAVDDSVSKTTGNVSGLFGAQRRIIKHQFVLERLLEEKFESRTDRRFIRMFQNEPAIFRRGMRESNDTEINITGEQKVGRYIEENGTRGGFPMKIPPMGR